MAVIDESIPDMNSSLSLNNDQLSTLYFDLLAFISWLPPPTAAASVAALTSIPLPSAAASSTMPSSTAGATQGSISAIASASVAAQIAASSAASVAAAEVSSAEAAAAAEASKALSEISQATPTTTTEAHPETENPVIQAPHPTTKTSAINIPTSLFH
jgi:hypothetical protein